MIMIIITTTITIIIDAYATYTQDLNDGLIPEVNENGTFDPFHIGAFYCMLSCFSDQCPPTATGPLPGQWIGPALQTCPVAQILVKVAGR